MTMNEHPFVVSIVIPVSIVATVLLLVPPIFSLLWQILYKKKNRKLEDTEDAVLPKRVNNEISKNSSENLRKQAMKINGYKVDNRKFSQTMKIVFGIILIFASPFAINALKLFINSQIDNYIKEIPAETSKKLFVYYKMAMVFIFETFVSFDCQ